ncbi:MAG TPA: PIN domain-containing protein [Anaerolineae bacterium]|nr:PIN domain-containing protein [Anaerolineae bacterium]HPL30188.1 PIN domain-containing protein [Anaerolineae bacterium]
MGGVAEFAQLLDDARVVGLDSMAFIYHFEAHPAYGALTQALFSRLERGDLRACTSALSLCEVLTGALKAGNSRLAQIYRQVFELLPNLSVAAVDTACAALAAQVRVESGLRTPDALQIAAAALGGAEAFITNDARLRQSTRIRVVVLGDYV